VIPTLIDPQALADGAVFTGDGLALLEEPNNVSVSVAPVIRFRTRADRAAATGRIDALPGVGRDGGPGLVRSEVPLEVERLEQVDRIPLALAAFLIVLGAIAIGHLLVTSVHRRARDFAVLKAIGFRRRQTYGTVFAQATTVAAVGVIVGLTVGVAAGSVIWRAAASRIGVLAEVDFPLPALVLVALGTIVLANVVAAFPAYSAARTPAAVVLRRD
jgi:putative ABC transport system permease protein